MLPMHACIMICRRVCVMAPAVGPVAFAVVPMRFAVAGAGNLLAFGRVGGMMSGCTGSLGTVGASALAPGCLAAAGLGQLRHLCLFRGACLVRRGLGPVCAGTLAGRRGGLFFLRLVLDRSGLRAALFRLVRLGSRLLLAMLAALGRWPMVAALGLGIIGPHRRAGQEKPAYRQGGSPYLAFQAAQHVRSP